MVDVGIKIGRAIARCREPVIIFVIVQLLQEVIAAALHAEGAEFIALEADFLAEFGRRAAPARV